MGGRTTKFVSGDAAFVVDKDGVIVSWNSKAEELFNFTTHQAIGERCWRLLSGKDVFGNQYCCERCPLMKMALNHESVNKFQALLKTCSNGYEKFNINCLVLYGNPGDELLMHICRFADEVSDSPVRNEINGRLPSNRQRRKLTSREIEVLEHLADGKTTREIASTLWISQATVRNHIHHLLNKLHVHNRLEAVVLGQRLSII